MVPENMYVIYHSLKHKQEKEENPDAFKTEKWYSKEFTVETLSESAMADLKSAQFEHGMQMGNAPPNTFMPKVIKPLVPTEFEAKPKLIQNDGNL